MAAAPKGNKLLFITQKIHQDDDDLAFVILWVEEFIRQGMEVQVICLEKGTFNGAFPVFSLGKEKGIGKIGQVLRFLRYMVSLKYDRVFVHMNPEYFTLGGWFWFLRRIPTYLWYTHYTTHIHLKLAAFYSKRMFAATPQSLPQYNESPKKVIVGHGIDIEFWKSTADENGSAHKSPYQLVSVHRICRSKRLEIAIKALTLLPSQYTLTVYGRDVEKDYYQELQELVAAQQLSSRVTFAGPVPMAQLKEIYPNYRLMINMAYETIDKTMLECMLFGIYPITTKNNAQAIGLPVFPREDTPEAVAQCILDGAWQSYDAPFLNEIVSQHHSLSALIKKMSVYIKEGV